MAGVKIDMLTCPEWHAKPPKDNIALANKAKRILIHHTAGHHPEIANPRNESVAEAIRYAQDIQRMHMAPGGLGAPNGGIDSGHNFLVCRNGVILQGRWHTVSAIEFGKMVWSAHCPGQNDQIGIEHEHLGHEEMTPVQKQASALLIAWISSCYGRKTPLPLAPHRQFYSTECPANLVSDIPWLRKRAQEILAGV
jgi:hypothetical protein